MKPLVEVLQHCVEYLEKREIENPKLDAQLLMGHSLGLSRLQIFMQHDRPLMEPELKEIRELLARRGQGCPMAYLLGYREFYSLTFRVGPGVLIPRPDTETLVSTALPLCEGDPCYLADVGTGSGCVGLTLAQQRSNLRVYACDLSPDALHYAQQNSLALGLQDRVGILQGHLLDAVPKDRPVDVLVSNPPYITEAELQSLAPGVRDYEPHRALSGGPDGLDLIRELLQQAAARVRRAVLIEIGWKQGEAVREIFETAGLSEVEVHQDLAGRDRVVAGRLD